MIKQFWYFRLPTNCHTTTTTCSPFKARSSSRSGCSSGPSSSPSFTCSYATCSGGSCRSCSVSNSSDGCRRSCSSLWICSPKPWKNKVSILNKVDRKTNWKCWMLAYFKKTTHRCTIIRWRWKYLIKCILPYTKLKIIHCYNEFIYDIWCCFVNTSKVF